MNTIKYWGGIPRWTGKDRVGKVAINDNKVYIVCNFHKAASSDPLGFDKNAGKDALTDLIKYIEEGVKASNGGVKIPPSGTYISEIVVGWDIAKEGWLENQSLVWSDFLDF